MSVVHTGDEVEIMSGDCAGSVGLVKDIDSDGNIVVAVQTLVVKSADDLCPVPDGDRELT